MLRTSLSRPPFRQFSTSSLTRNIPRHPNVEGQKEEQLKANPEPIPSSSIPSADNFHSSSPLASEPAKPHIQDAQNSLPPYDLELVKQRIREWTEQAAIVLRTRSDDFTSNTKTTFSQLGFQFNKVTGYDEIEALKRGVVEQEERINIARQAAREAKTAYEQAVIQRSNSQREVNDLLQRKSSWSDSDVGRFTTLVRQDHLYEQEESRSKAAVDETEDAVEREFSQLMRTILARYHEEQVWSDKIRSASTYGSLAALGLNMLVFIMAIVVVEPWKRRRLAQTFERKIEELSTDNATRLDASMQAIEGHIARQEESLEFLKMEVSRKVIPEPIEEVKVVEPIMVVQPIAISRRQWEIAAVGGGAFMAGILSTILLSR
ncbi:Mdm33 family-domain-containing protein [Crassisporium funariophilum]|nr:Mdm33 family-domain-containing protein [Crassisporium funariophilum]